MKPGRFLPPDLAAAISAKWWRPGDWSRNGWRGLDLGAPDPLIPRPLRVPADRIPPCGALVRPEDGRWVGVRRTCDARYTLLLHALFAVDLMVDARLVGSTLLACLPWGDEP